ncbi:MAG TPA: amidase family protein, partial [Allocoleopsis sp.]
WLSPPEISFLSASQRLPNKLKIAFATNIKPIGNADEKTTQSVVNTAKKLADLGHELIEIPLDLTGLIEPFVKVWQGGVAAAGIPPELLSPLNQWILSQVGTVGEYLQAVSTMEIIARQIISLFDNFDVLLLPVYMHTPIKIGEWAELSVTETFLKIVNWVAPCPPFNASGQPAISLPVEFDQETGLPIGLQLVGKPGDESTIISLASQLENALSLRNYPVLD